MAESKYDVSGVRPTFVRAICEKEPSRYARQRAEAGRELLRDLAGAVEAAGIEGVTVTRVSDDQIMIGSMGVEIFVGHRTGRLIVHGEYDAQRPPDVSLIFDPVDQKFLGPRYEVVDPRTGEKVTRHRDALLFTLEAVIARLRG